MTKDDRKFEIHFYPVPDSLEPYFTVLYFTHIELPDGLFIEDTMQPEWAALRITADASPRLAFGKDRMVDKGPFVAVGPSSRSLRFRLGGLTSWGLGLHPAGWACYVDAKASDLANTVMNARTHPAFARLATAFANVSYDRPADVEAGRLLEELGRLESRAPRSIDRIIACQNALSDPQLEGVAELRERVGVSAKTLERLCLRYFGFTPNKLVRRQRFLRSIDQFMRHKSMKWIGAIDSHYHDQAQFIREFRTFMGLSPREFAEMPHPLLDGIISSIMVEQRVSPDAELPSVLKFPMPDRED